MRELGIECRVCEGLGHVRGVPCECVHNVARLRALQQASIPYRYWDIDWSRIVELLESNRIALSGSGKDLLLGYGSSLINRVANGDGLWICGPVDKAKTSISCALGQLGLSLGYSCRFIRYSSLVGLVIEGDPEVGWIRHKVNILILDDIGRESNSQSGYNKTLLNNVIRDVLEGSNRILIANTNLKLADLGTRYGPAVESIATDQFARVQVIRADFRDDLSQNLESLLVNGKG